MTDQGPPRLEASVAMLAERLLRASDDRRVVLGIAGPPGVGKSTLADRLAARLGPEVAVVVPMDGFHLSSQELQRLGLAHRKGAPETFDAEGFAATVARIVARTDRVVYVPHFDRDLEEPVAAGTAVEAAVPVVITEGNYLLLDDPAWARARVLMDELWYVDEEPEVRLQRLRQRHERFGRSEAAAQDWVRSVDEPNARLVESTARGADLVVRVVDHPGRPAGDQASTGRGAARGQGATW